MEIFLCIAATYCIVFILLIFRGEYQRAQLKKDVETFWKNGYHWDGEISRIIPILIWPGVFFIKTIGGLVRVITWPARALGRIALKRKTKNDNKTTKKSNRKSSR